jgi:hypothetical protein
MNLIALINHIEKSFPKLFNPQLKEFISKFSNSELPDTISLVFQKIQDEILLDNEDIQSLNEEMTKLDRLSP